MGKLNQLVRSIIVPLTLLGQVVMDAVKKYDAVIVGAGFG
jgi:hypothetical protein